MIHLDKTQTKGWAGVWRGEAVAESNLRAEPELYRSFLTISSSSSSSLGAAGSLAGVVTWKNGSSPFSSLIPPVRLRE